MIDSKSKSEIAKPKFIYCRVVGENFPYSLNLGPRNEIKLEKKKKKMKV